MLFISRYAFICCLTLMISGCALIGAGYYPISNKETTFETQALESPYIGALGKSVLRSKDDCSPYIHEKLASFNSKEDLLKYWGTPDKIEKIGAKERFIYNGSLQFSGVYAVVMIVPIPIVFPSQRKHCIVETDNGLITRLVKIEQADDYGYGCAGFFFQEEGSRSAFGCGAEKWNGNPPKNKSK